MTVMTADRFDKKYNELVELKTKLELATESEKEVIERKIKVNNLFISLSLFLHSYYIYYNHQKDIKSYME